MENQLSFLLPQGCSLALIEDGVEYQWKNDGLATLVEVSGRFYNDAAQGAAPLLPSIMGYSVHCKAITIPEVPHPEDYLVAIHYKGEEVNFTQINTSTDIGGKYLAIIDHQKKRTLYLCHLHNGFGDGTYHLRFRDGQIIR